MRLFALFLMVLAVIFTPASAWAGGSGLSIILVVNQNSSNSLELANNYCEARGVPPQNVLRMTGWTGGAVTWSRADFESALRDPLLAMLAARGLTNQAQFVLLSMDIPYRVVAGSSQNSTTSALFYGFKTNTTPPAGLPVTCSLPDASSNSYAFSEMPLGLQRPNTAETNSFLAMMLTDTSLAGAQAILAGAVASDSTFPSQAVYLEKTTDSSRNVRFFEFEAQNAPAVGDWLSLNFIKTNGALVTVGLTNNSPSGSIGAPVQGLINAVNASPSMQSADGALAGDLYASGTDAQFFLYARSSGWPAAQASVSLSASSGLMALPTGTNTLEDNLSDLRPRDHLYIASGLPVLPLGFALDTTQLADGFHELTAVAYEGTSVRTQTRVLRTVQVQNTPLIATLTPLFAGTNAALDQPLQFAVAANPTNIALIELFSTGGSIGVASNRPAAVFSIPPATLGLGLHPFYALVTDTSGNRYQTQTAWIRLIPSIHLTLTGPPLALTWPAIPGRDTMSSL